MIFKIIYHPISASHPFPSLLPFPPSHLPTSVHPASLSPQKRCGLPWISTGLVISSCSKIRLISYWGSPVRGWGSEGRQWTQTTPAPAIRSPTERPSCTTVSIYAEGLGLSQAWYLVGNSVSWAIMGAETQWRWWSAGSSGLGGWDMQMFFFFFFFFY